MTDPHDCTEAVIRITADVVNDRDVFREEFLKKSLCVCRAIFQLWRKNFNLFLLYDTILG